ncbi:RNA 3'-terminal phosphate cyclase [Aquabacterium humicola]|uniref:RNA 3'-terminal phosphate cyclase n=1 Tax=Aquabacterium humicola TaxID=3237377 RepID=UPI0025437D2A|nr:RNA 3'-terminal phosphate cyclase [Rubrivivax pictus]
MNVIELDGSTGEGGGQILRTGLALSMCTGQPMLIQRIRAKRAKPGLMRQHLTCVQAAVAVCGARVEGAELGSQTVVFEPGAVRAGDYAFNVGTAGSCTLVLQTVLPALMLGAEPSRVSLSGGTHNPMAPPFHFLERSFAPLLRRLGVGLDLDLRRLGFYPAGGGEISAVVHPAAAGLQPFDLTDRGPLQEAYAECFAPALPSAVAARELAALSRALGWSGEQLRTPAVRQNEGPGNALMATLGYAHVNEVVTSFGEKGVRAEQVADALVQEIRAHQASEGALGQHLADQWMLPLALAVAARGGEASFTCTTMTDHATTNIGVIEQFLPVRFDVHSTGSCPRVRVIAGQATER